MGHQFIIESDEAFALATELASIRGISVQEAVVDAVRSRLQHERDLQAKITKVKRLAAEFRATLNPPLPTSDHRFLYDPETGLPV